MAVDVLAANEYMNTFVVNKSAWDSSDEATKERALNNAERIILRRYNNRSIPDEAVFEQALWLLKLNEAQNQTPEGVVTYSIDGISVTLSQIDRTIAPETMAILGRRTGLSISGRQGYVVRGDVE